MARMGENIYKRKDGRWEGRCIIGHDENGRAFFRYLYGRSYKEVKDQIENCRNFSACDGQPLQPIEGVAYYALVQSPIISSGDVCGSVMFLQNKESDRPGDAEQKLIQAAASYLGKQMEL